MPNINEIIEEAKQTRDEIRRKIHLGSKDLQDEWSELEDKWNDFEAKAKFGDAADDIGDAAGEGQDALVLRLVVCELRETRVALVEGDRHAVRHGELGGVAGGRPVLGGQRLPEAVHQPLAGLADDGLDLLAPDALLRQAAGAVDVGVDHGAAGIGLERDRLRMCGRSGQITSNPIHGVNLAVTLIDSFSGGLFTVGEVPVLTKSNVREAAGHSSRPFDSGSTLSFSEPWMQHSVRRPRGH